MAQLPAPQCRSGAGHSPADAGAPVAAQLPHCRLLPAALRHQPVKSAETPAGQLSLFLCTDGVLHHFADAELPLSEQRGGLVVRHHTLRRHQSGDEGLAGRCGAGAPGSAMRLCRGDVAQLCFGTQLLPPGSRLGQRCTSAGPCLRLSLRQRQDAGHTGTVLHLPSGQRVPAASLHCRRHQYHPRHIYKQTPVQHQAATAHASHAGGLPDRYHAGRPGLWDEHVRCLHRPLFPDS